jgi:hypothetical protein
MRTEGETGQLQRWRVLSSQAVQMQVFGRAAGRKAQANTGAQ